MERNNKFNENATTDVFGGSKGLLCCEKGECKAYFLAVLSSSTNALKVIPAFRLPQGDTLEHVKIELLAEGMLPFGQEVDVSLPEWTITLPNLTDYLGKNYSVWVTVKTKGGEKCRSVAHSNWVDLPFESQGYVPLLAWFGIELGNDAGNLTYLFSSPEIAISRALDESGSAVSPFPASGAHGIPGTAADYVISAIGSNDLNAETGAVFQFDGAKDTYALIKGVSYKGRNNLKYEVDVDVAALVADGADTVTTYRIEADGNNYNATTNPTPGGAEVTETVTIGFNTPGTYDVKLVLVTNNYATEIYSTIKVKLA